MELDNQFLDARAAGYHLPILAGELIESWRVALVAQAGESPASSSSLARRLSFCQPLALLDPEASAPRAIPLGHRYAATEGVDLGKH